MELVVTTIVVVGGMAFSLTVALLVEELIFGKVLGLFFVPRVSEARQSGEVREPLAETAGPYC
jgi:hypothetical protein